MYSIMQHVSTPVQMVTRDALIFSALAVVFFFNIADAILTLWAVRSGHAIEANPIMAAVLSLGPLPFLLVKVGMVSAGLNLLWRLRSSALAGYGSLAVFGAYLFVMGCHIETLRLMGA